MGRGKKKLYQLFKEQKIQERFSDDSEVNFINSLQV